MSTGFFNLKKALQLFGTNAEDMRSRGVTEGDLPAFARSELDNRLLKSWSLTEMPAVGEKIGFMKKPSRPVAVAVFVTKGGVLKSTLTLNLARMAALHGLRVCVLGLDMQGDITSSLSGEDAVEENDSLEEAMARIDSLRGLPDLFTGGATLDEVIRPTDIPTLFYIPETPELVALDQSLVNRNRREYWLAENVVAPLKKKFDLVIMDCSPNWNRLITNALIASDALISPLECKINNFRNFKTFRALLAEFRSEMQAGFKQIFVPTRLAPSRKLSREICDWYRASIAECSVGGIRESLQGEEAVAMRISIPEYAPTSAAADEIRELLQEIWLELSATHIPRPDHGLTREQTL
jgi:chromosome partitioning protein